MGCASGPRYDSIRGWLRLFGASVRAVRRRFDFDDSRVSAVLHDLDFFLRPPLTPSGSCFLECTGTIALFLNSVGSAGMIGWLRMCCSGVNSLFMHSILFLYLPILCSSPDAAAQVGRPSSEEER